MRSAWLSLVALAALSTPAAAQINAVPGVNDSYNSFPMFGIPLQEADKDDNYRRLPFRELTNAIHIEAGADLFYDFQSGQVRASASDLLQQVANLIYDRARSPVRIECRSDRTPAAAAQKLAQACANAVAQYLTTQEKVTNVKFTAVGVSVPPPAPPDPNDPFAPLPARQNHIVIDFAKK